MLQKDKIQGNGPETVLRLAKQQPDRVGRAKIGRRPMDCLAAIAKEAYRQDISTFELLMGVTRMLNATRFSTSWRGSLQREESSEEDQLSRAIILRGRLQREEPRARACRNWRAFSFPRSKIDEASERRPGVDRRGSILIPSRSAVNSSTTLKFEAAAIEPPYDPYPAPSLAAEPWPIPEADFRRAAGADRARRNKMGVGEKFPSIAQLFLTQMSRIAAGELSHQADHIRGLANIADAALTGNQKAAARLRDA